MVGGRLHSVVYPPVSVSSRLSTNRTPDTSDGYPMAEAVDEATFVVRQFLEDPKNDSVSSQIICFLEALIEVGDSSHLRRILRKR